MATQSFARLVRPSSLPVYALWKLAGRRWTASVGLADGPSILLRPPSSGNNDYGVAYEVFLHEHYTCPQPLAADSVHLIVDLGANVGFSCLWWLTRYPAATLVALEPHPAHFRQCRANLAANGLLARTELHEAAAGAAPGQIALSDAGTSSAVLEPGAAGLPAAMLDVFALLADRPVDILKMDIEGGEYAILGDPRFALLRPRCLVMEWHGTRNDRDWCLSRFASLDYDTMELFDHESYGMLWAFRRGPDGPR